MSITQGGLVGIGTNAPSNRLHVNDVLGIRQNQLYISGDAGWSSITYNAYHNPTNTAWVFPDTTRPSMTIEMDDSLGRARFEVWSNLTGVAGAWRRRLAVNGQTGDVVLAENGGNVGVGTNAPGVRLHVQDSKSGDADNPLVHVALIENTSGSNNADVLALKVGINPAEGGNNFITFFGGNTALASFEGDAGGSVSFNTLGADFAEYLPKLDEAETIEEGDLVGIVAGKATRTTRGAHSVAAITSHPVVVGGSVPREERHRYARVAFVGQVSVKVRGPVRAGDFIVPSGLDDGTGCAVEPPALTPELAVQVAGQAWGGSTLEGVKLVRIAVGMHTGLAVARALMAVRSNA
jgi:hypothetical protein